MKRRDRKELERYIRWCADEMELRDWTFILSPEPPEIEDAVATINPTEGRKHAELRLCAHFRGRDPEDQRQTIIHELLHCHFQPADQVIEEDMGELLGKAAHLLAFKSYRRSLEYAIDATAAALAKHFPLIDWQA